jgi:hypothetical protein
MPRSWGNHDAGDTTRRDHGHAPRRQGVLLPGSGSGHGTPALLGTGGGVDAEARDEWLVARLGHAGQLRAAAVGEYGDVRALPIDPRGPSSRPLTDPHVTSGVPPRFPLDPSRLLVMAGSFVSQW